MSYQAFKNIKLKPETLKIVSTADQIIKSFQRQGYRLTLRQLYYQFVTKNLGRRVMWVPMTLKDWLSLLWFVLVRPEPPPAVHTSDDPNDYCPMCGQRWRNP